MRTRTRVGDLITWLVLPMLCAVWPARALEPPVSNGYQALVDLYRALGGDWIGEAPGEPLAAAETGELP